MRTLGATDAAFHVLNDINRDKELIAKKVVDLKLTDRERAQLSAQSAELDMHIEEVNATIWRVKKLENVQRADMSNHKWFAETYDDRAHTCAVRAAAFRKAAAPVEGDFNPSNAFEEVVAELKFLQLRALQLKRGQELQLQKKKQRVRNAPAIVAGAGVVALIAWFYQRVQNSKLAHTRRAIALVGNPHKK